MKKRNIFWGIIFICAAGLLILEALGKSMGFFDMSQLPILRIVLGAICVALIIESILEKSVAGIFMPISFIVLIFEKELAGFLNISSGDIAPTWVIILVGVLLTFGFGALFPSNHSKKHEAGEGDKDADYKMGKFEEWIDCNYFDEYSIDNKMGACDVYFKNPENYKGDGVLYIDNNMGGVNVNIPLDWTPVTNIENHMGGIEMPKDITQGGKIIKIEGDNNLGGIVIKYVG